MIEIGFGGGVTAVFVAGVNRSLTLWLKTILTLATGIRQAHFANAMATGWRPTRFAPKGLSCVQLLLEQR